MTSDSHLDSTVQADRRAQTKLAVGAMLVPLFFVTVFAACIIGAYHKPHPNNIKLGVVGPPALTAPVTTPSRGLRNLIGSRIEQRHMRRWHGN